MADEVDYRALATKKFAEWGLLFERMQTDADAVNMVYKTLKLLDADNHEIPHSVRVPLNDIASFAWQVETTLNSAVEQVEVISENKRFDTAYVERFIRTAFTENDKVLSSKGMFPFNPFNDQQTFRRGRVSSFCNFTVKDKVLIPNITSWDTRYVVVENDSKGIYYIAAKFYRSESQILAEYPEAKGQTSFGTSGTDTEMLYIISRNTSQIWLGTNLVQGDAVGGSLIKELPNKLGYVPAVYRMVPMGSMLQDKATIQYMGESGLFLIRDVFPEVVRLASIIQSLNLKVVDQALQIGKSVTGSAGNATPQKTVDELNAPGAVNEIPETGSGYQLMPLGQLAVFQADKVHQMLEDRMQRGMSSYYQNVLQPKTATEIMKISQQQADIILPRIGTRGLEKQDLAYMFIKQTIDAAEKAKVQTVKLGNQEFEVSKLKGEYEIEYKYHFQDPRMDAARQSLATSQRGLIPDRDIRINTLQREDWEGDERQLRWEEDERISPLVKLDRNIRALLEDAKRGVPGAERQAKMLIIQMIPALRQAMEGLLTPNKPDEIKPAQPIIPLLSERAQSQQGGQNATQVG